MSDDTRPYFVWMTEYPEEGSIAVDAASELDAIEKSEWLLGTGEDRDEDEILTEALTAKRVTADDVHDLQEAAERVKFLEARLRKHEPVEATAGT